MSTSWTLSSGATRAMTPMSSICLVGLVVAQRRNSAPVIASPGCRAGGDGLGRHGVVAGDHADLHARGVGLGDRVLGLGAWRVDDADERQQRHRRAAAAGRRWDRTCAGSKSFRPVARTRSPCSPRRWFSAWYGSRTSSTGVERAVGRRPRWRPAPGAGRARPSRSSGSRRFPVRVGHPVEGGHHLVLGVERERRDPRELLAGQGRVDPALLGEDDEGALGRVADESAVLDHGVGRTAPSAAGTASSDAFA